MSQHNSDIMSDLTAPESNYRLLPPKHPDIWSAYKKHMAVFWTAEQIDMKNDYGDWQKLTKEEQRFLELVLAFFAVSDGLVNENLNANFMNEFSDPSVKCFYGWQNATENIHAETYQLLLDNLIRDQRKKEKLFDSINNFESIRAKAQWMKRWMDDSSGPLKQRIIAFSIVEGDRKSVV